MFQRLRDTIDRTIAEEQARMRGPNSASHSRSSSSSRRSESSAKRTRPKTSVDFADSIANPDPAVFEAAFVIDDTDDPPSQSSAAKPPTSAVASTAAAAAAAAAAGDADLGDAATAPNKPDMRDVSDDAACARVDSERDGAEARQDAAKRIAKPASPAPALTPEIRAKLRKLDKLEQTYPELLRSYRVAHRRATAIEPFEKALREHTPLTSIADPEALVEYLNQLKLKGDMVMDELKRVSADKDELRKSKDECGKKYKTLQERFDVLKAAMPAEAGSDIRFDSSSSESDGATSKSPEKSTAATSTTDGVQDFFSYDDEIPALQAEIEAKSKEIEVLKADIDDIKTDLVVARAHSADLAVSLEKSALEVSQLREAAAAEASMQSKLDLRNAELSTLTQKLDVANYQVRDLEKKLQDQQAARASDIEDIKVTLAASERRSSGLDADLAKATAAKVISDQIISSLNTQLDALQRDKEENKSKIDELTQKLSARARSLTPAPPAQSGTAPLAPQPSPSGTAGGGASKKKNKKKKGKGAAAAAPSALSAAEEDAASEIASEPAHAVDLPAVDVSALEAQITQLKEEVAEKDALIERLSRRKKTEEDLREEIETLQENLLTIGQDHVEDKQAIKELEQEKRELKKEVDELENQVSSMSSGRQASEKLQGDMDALHKEFEELKEKSTVLQSDLGAAQQLAQTRFKDLTELREVLQKVQPELKGLRQDAAALKAAREELAVKVKEIRELERKEKELRKDLAQAQQLTADREREIKLLQDKVAGETNTRLRLEDAQRVSGRDLRRSEAERVELSSKAEKAERELEKVREEADKLRPRVRELEDQMHRLKREKSAASEEAEFKTQQYSNAQGLLSSMRDQAAELTVQLKESQSQAESLEEELAEVQRLLQERTREGETMRRLLADVDERADNKVREMRSRMEAAMEERDRLEDESTTLARRRARETEELKQKVRDLEREAKALGHEKDELEQREKEWRRRRESLELVEAKAEAETGEMRAAMTQLRATLDASEDQAREGEKQRSELRRMLEDSRARYDKLVKDLKTAQTRLASAGAAGRSSMDSVRSGGTANGGAGAPDTMYLKTILLQFLEQKDGKLRAQLVPVLGKLLKFDKADEKKWLTAVQHIEVR